MTQSLQYQVDTASHKILDKFEQSAMRTQAWRTKAVEFYRMYNTDQWSAKERKYLEDSKRFPITLNIIAPIVDGFVSLLASENPRYKAIPATPMRDNVIARAADFMLEYNAYHSQFSHEFVHAMRDYAISGVGWMMADVDPIADYGSGEIVNRWSSWAYVFWDWRAKRPGFKDMEWVIVFNWITGAKLKAMYRDKEALITEATTRDFDSVSAFLTQFGSSSSDNIVFLPSDIPGNFDRDEWFEGDEKMMPVLEHYEYVYIQINVVSDPILGYDQYFTDEEWELAKLEFSGAVRAKVYQVTIPRVKRTVCIGGWKVLDETILPVTVIPVIPFVRMSTGSSLPQGIVERAMDVQVDYNKRRLAIIENAMATSAGRILAPKGMIDDDEWYKLSRFPGAKINYKSSMAGQDNPIIQLQAQPLPNQFYYLEQTQIQLAEYITGVNGMFMGAGDSMPDTYRQSLMIEDYGRRRIKAIDMSSIDASLQILGQCTLELDQWWYTFDKQLTICDDEGRVRQFLLTRTDLSEEGIYRASLDDFGTTRFNVRIISGSTMPKNKYALLELYLSLYDRGLVLHKHVLKHTDIVEIDEVIKEIDQVQKMEQMVGQLQEEMEAQSGMIDKLKNQLVGSDMKDQSRSLMLAETVASLQRQAAERLAKMATELSQRAFIRNVKREEDYQAKMGKMRTQNLVDRTEDYLANVKKQSGSDSGGKKKG